MGRSFMEMSKNAKYLVAFVVGAIFGIVGSSLVRAVHKQKNNTYYVERHEGQRRFINPILGCDVAEEFLGGSELRGFKNKIEAIVKSHSLQNVNMSVYFRELNDGIWFSVGDTEKFVPASLRKVPLMLALLKQSELEKGLLERTVTYDLSNDYNASQNVKPSKVLENGGKYSVRELIFRMIVYSDNNAFTFLAKIVNPAELERVYITLRFLNPVMPKEDEFLSVQTYASFFRVLYNSSYLDRELSDWALEILSKSEFKAGIVAGVPPNVTVSHKFGEKSDAATGINQLHDCGIVYYPKHPYLLCVMSKGPDFQVLDDTIVEISRSVFSEVDLQSRK